MAKKKPATKQPATKKPAAKKAARQTVKKTKQTPALAKKAAKQGAARQMPKKQPGQKHALQRADYGQPVDGFFAKQPSPQREILAELRKAIASAAPGAQASLKWGQPFYSLAGKMLFALSSHKAHVNLIMVGPPDKFADPEGRLSGEGKGGRHLKAARVEDLPSAAVLRSWLQVAVDAAR